MARISDQRAEPESLDLLSCSVSAIHPGRRGAVTSAFMLVCLHGAINAVWFGAMVMLIARLTRLAGSGRFQRALKATTGAVFIAFGVKLAALRP